MYVVRLTQPLNLMLQCRATKIVHACSQKKKTVDVYPNETNLHYTTVYVPVRVDAYSQSITFG